MLKMTTPIRAPLRTNVATYAGNWIRSGNHRPLGSLGYLKSTPTHLFNRMFKLEQRVEELPLNLKPSWPGFCQAAWTLLAGFRRSCIDLYGLYGKPLASANSMRLCREHSQTICKIYDIEYVYYSRIERVNYGSTT